MSKKQEDRWISLQALYDFVRTHKNDKPLHSCIREYGRLCKSLTSVIDGEQGFYLWGRYEPNLYWNGIYLGVARHGKTASLRARILEELKDEHWFLWRHVFAEERVLQYSDEVRASDSRRRACSRAMLKAGTTHIVWFPDNLEVRDNVLRVEADLIEALNPSANRRRPTPPNTVQVEATKVFEGMRRTIHSARASAFKVTIPLN